MDCGALFSQSSSLRLADSRVDGDVLQFRRAQESVVVVNQNAFSMSSCFNGLLDRGNAQVRLRLSTDGASQ